MHVVVIELSGMTRCYCHNGITCDDGCDDGYVDGYVVNLVVLIPLQFHPPTHPEIGFPKIATPCGSSSH